MEAVGARLADRVDDPARRAPIFGWEAASQHRKLLNRVDAQHNANHVSWCRVSIINDGDPINSVIVEG
jgi:hypothetical protein